MKNPDQFKKLTNAEYFGDGYLYFEDTRPSEPYDCRKGDYDSYKDFQQWVNKREARESTEFKKNIRALYEICVAVETKRQARSVSKLTLPRTLLLDIAFMAGFFQPAALETQKKMQAAYSRFYQISNSSTTQANKIGNKIKPH